MKQTLKIGQKYRVIQDDSSSPIEPGTIITVKKLISLERFYDENDNEWWFDPEYLELIKPKTKKVKKLKFTKEERDSMLEWWNKFNGEERTLKLIELYKSATKSQPIKEEHGGSKPNGGGGGGIRGLSFKPIKEESKDIEKLELFFNEDEDCYEINEMRHSDSRIDLLAEKINEIIDSLTKRNIK